MQTSNEQFDATTFSFTEPVSYYAPRDNENKLLAEGVYKCKVGWAAKELKRSPGTSEGMDDGLYRTLRFDPCDDLGHTHRGYSVFYSFDYPIRVLDVNGRPVLTQVTESNAKTYLSKNGKKFRDMAGDKGRKYIAAALGDKLSLPQYDKEKKSYVDFLGRVLSKEQYKAISGEAARLLQTEFNRRFRDHETFIGEVVYAKVIVSRNKDGINVNYIDRLFGALPSDMSLKTDFALSAEEKAELDGVGF